MGKKSRKSASKPSGKAGASSLAAAVASIIGGDTGKKPKKCVRCLASLKDTSKAHQCPGCLELYCWRCERKNFEQCPNGENCVHPISRCFNCANARTLESLLKSGRIEIPELLPGEKLMTKGANGATLFNASFFRHFEEFVNRKDNNLTFDALPLRNCLGQGCQIMECYRCLVAPENISLQRCSICEKSRCHDCCESPMKKLLSGDHTTVMLIAAAEAYTNMNDMSLHIAAKTLREEVPDLYANCGECLSSTCYQCLDDGMMGMCASTLFDIISAKVSGTEASASFKCTRCY